MYQACHAHVPRMPCACIRACTTHAACMYYACTMCECFSHVAGQNYNMHVKCNIHVSCMKSVQNPCMLHETCMYINMETCMLTCMLCNACRYNVFCMKHACYMHDILSRVPTVPFNYNFIFTCVNTRGITRNVHSIPVTCLRGPRFLVACVVYFITGTTRVKQLLSLHSWNKPRVHSHV